MNRTETALSDHLAMLRTGLDRSARFANNGYMKNSKPSSNFWLPALTASETRTASLGLTLVGPESPRNFSAQGEKYLKAAKIIIAQNQRELEWPIFFLLCQALELYLKAFLRFKGVSVEDLRNPRKFCHDLQRGFKMARGMAQGLETASSFTDELEKCIEVVGPIYKERDFQYTNTGIWTLVDIRVFLPLVENVSRKFNW
jgi:hypothetical protein